MTGAVSTSELLPRYAPPPGRHVRAGMVMSADGGSSSGGTSGALSTPADRAVFQVLRAHADVVLVGAGTARTEGYGPVVLPAEHQAWRRDHGRTHNPPLALVSRSLDLPAKALPGAIVLAVDAAAGQQHEGSLRVRDLAGALDQLAERGLTRVLCEGGPTLLGDLVAAGLLDELCCTVSPRLVGTAPGLVHADLPGPVALDLSHVVEHEGSLLLRWTVRH